jgi:hypothetical protein
LLAYEVGNLEKEKEELEAAIRTNKGLLQETLAQKLMILKIQRPDLFTISGQEQIARMLVPKLVCEVSDASDSVWFVSVYGGLSCE